MFQGEQAVGLVRGDPGPNISVMYFFKVECTEQTGFISHTGRCAAVFSETRTFILLFVFFLMRMTVPRSSIL